MKKKLFALLMCGALVLSLLAACGTAASSSEAVSTEPASSEEASSEAASSESTAVEETADDTAAEGDAAQGVDGKNIGICIYKFDDNFMTLYRNELERYLSAGGASVQVMDGKNDQAEQTNQINNFITTGVDVLIINLVQSSSAPQITDLCAAANIPVVFINREPEPAEEERWETDSIQATYVGADARQSGTFQGELIADLDTKGDADGDGVVRYAMIMGDPENIDAQYRTEFSIKALTDAGIEVEELFNQRGDWDQTKGQELAANALTANGDKLDVIFCNNDAMAMGALQSIEAAGRTVGEDIYLVGVDALAEALTAIGEGRMTGTVFNDHIAQSHTAADMASNYINGVDVANVNMVDYQKVTTENAPTILDMIS